MYNKFNRHPWNKWFKKRKFTIRKPEDYQCMTHSMVAQIRSEAGKRNKKVSIQVVGKRSDEILVIVRK